MAVYVSYIIVLACVLWTRLTQDFKPGPWNFGRKTGTVANLLALVYTIYATIWLPFPNYLPVTASNMNYSGPVLGAVLILAISLWVLRARTHWPGPNREVVDFILKSES